MRLATEWTTLHQEKPIIQPKLRAKENKTKCTIQTQKLKEHTENSHDRSVALYRLCVFFFCRFELNTSFLESTANRDGRFIFPKTIDSQYKMTGKFFHAIYVVPCDTNSFFVAGRFLGFLVIFWLFKTRPAKKSRVRIVEWLNHHAVAMQIQQQNQQEHSPAQSVLTNLRNKLLIRSLNHVLFGDSHSHTHIYTHSNDVAKIANAQKPTTDATFIHATKHTIRQQPRADGILNF